METTCYESIKMYTKQMIRSINHTKQEGAGNKVKKILLQLKGFPLTIKSNLNMKISIRLSCLTRSNISPSLMRSRAVRVVIIIIKKMNLL